MWELNNTKSMRSSKLECNTILPQSLVCLSSTNLHFTGSYVLNAEEIADEAL